MANCRKCNQGYEAKDWQVAKSDYLCDSCRKEYFKEYRRRRKDNGNPVVPISMPREWHREYQKEYRKKPDVLSRDAARQREIRQDPIHKKRIMANYELNRAVESGIIRRWHCENCGAEPAQGHHPDYDKPLEVIWLCPMCHAAEHRKAKGE